MLFRAFQDITFVNALPNPESQITRHVVFSRTGNKLTIQVDDTYFEERTITGSISIPEATKAIIEKSRIRFRGGDGINPPTIQSLYMEITNVAFQTCFSSKQELQQAVDDYILCNDDVSCKASLGYGFPIGNWCTGQITDMSDIFKNKDAFNEPLTYWDTAKVTRMK